MKPAGPSSFPASRMSLTSSWLAPAVPQHLEKCLSLLDSAQTEGSRVYRRRDTRIWGKRRDARAACSAKNSCGEEERLLFRGEINPVEER